jgi:hypothetical protein
MSVAGSVPLIVLDQRKWPRRRCMTDGSLVFVSRYTGYTVHESIGPYTWVHIGVEMYQSANEQTTIPAPRNQEAKSFILTRVFPPSWG